MSSSQSSDTNRRLFRSRFGFSGESSQDLLDGDRFASVPMSRKQSELQGILGRSASMTMGSYPRSDIYFSSAPGSQFLTSVDSNLVCSVCGCLTS